MIYEILARHTACKLMEKLLDSALCSVKMDLCTVEELNRDDNLISDIVVVIYLEGKLRLDLKGLSRAR